MERVSLTAQPRTEVGSSAARRARRQGRVPAVMYGRGADTVQIAVDARDLYSVLHTDAGANVLIDLDVEGDQHLAVAREIQRHPLREDILHLDFVKISLTDRIEAEVGIDFVGNPIGVKDEGGILETVRNIVTLEALPTEVPASIEIDISALHIGDSLSVADLPDLEGIDYVDDPETTIATVVAPRLEVEPEVDEELEGELAEGDEEGEEAAEGDAEADSDEADGDTE